VRESIEEQKLVTSSEESDEISKPEINDMPSKCVGVRERESDGVWKCKDELEIRLRRSDV
jgi:hypothetical protein